MSTAAPICVGTPLPVRSHGAEVWVVSLLCLLVTFVSCCLLSPVYGWLITGCCMFLFILFLGRWIVGRPLGVLVSERNLMSLGRFQMIAWTILLLSAYFSIALKRLYVLSANSQALPLNIAMDWRLWALMGISATSLVGSPLLLNAKSMQTPSDKTVDQASRALNEPAESISANGVGLLYSNTSPADACLSDMFQGDDIGNAAYIDASKLQMFYFTVIALLTYGYAIYTGLGNVYPQQGFTMPVPSDALLALVGISHAAYLTGKTAQHL